MKIELDLPQVPEGWRFVGHVITKEGQAYINSDNEFKIATRNLLCSFLTFERIEPEIDTELEEAKKLIGKWVEHRNSNARLYLIDEVSRDADNNVVALTDKCWFYIEEITPFPIPTWRCCESDKPKKSGDYFIRVKEYPETKQTYRYDLNGNYWDGMIILSRNEWLDEGER